MSDKPRERPQVWIVQRWPFEGSDDFVVHSIHISEQGAKAEVQQLAVSKPHQEVQFGPMDLYA